MGVCAGAWLGSDEGSVIGAGAWLGKPHVLSPSLSSSLSPGIHLKVNRNRNPFQLGRVILRSTRKLISV